MRFAVAFAVLAATSAPAAAQNRFDAFAGVSAGVGYSETDGTVPIVSVRGGALLSPSLTLFGEGWTHICRDSRALGLGLRYQGRGNRSFLEFAAGAVRRAVGEPGTGCFPDAFKRNTGLWLGSRYGVELTRDKYYALELSLRGGLEEYFSAYRSFDDQESDQTYSIARVALEFGVSFY